MLPYNQPQQQSAPGKPRRVWFTGKTINTSAAASRTNLTRDTSSALTTAKTILAVGSILIRDPMGWDKGIGVDFTQPATAFLHEQKVVVVSIPTAIEGQQDPDPATNGYGQWIDVVDYSEDVPCMIFASSVTTGQTRLAVVDASFALDTVAYPTTAGAAITDSSGGTAGTTIAANACKQVIYLPLGPMASLVTAVSIGVAMPFAFTATSVLFRADQPITTTAKAVTLTSRIDTTNMTGGVISVANTYATNATQAGTAITALNTGTAGQVLNVLTSAITTFIEGSGHVEFIVTNNDLANALATLTAGINNGATLSKNGCAVPVEPGLSGLNLGTTPATKRCRFSSEACVHNSADQA